MEKEIETIDRYSPGRTLKAPESLQQLHINSNINIRKGTSFFAENAFSVQNNNIFSKKSSSQINGNALRIGLNQDPVVIGRGDMSFNIELWQNSKGFRTFGRDRKVNFNESWDILNKSEGLNESMLSLMSKINIGNQLKSNIQLSRFEKDNLVKDRQINFQELNGEFTFLNGLTNPFITYAHEMREKGYRFDDIFIGLNHTKNFWFYSIGLGERNDYLSIKEKDFVMEKGKTGKYVQMDIKSSKPSGWRQSWIYRQRVQKNDKDQNQDSFN